MRLSWRGWAGLTGTIGALAVVGVVLAWAEMGGADEPARRVADLLDSVVQPRFQKDAGVFGTSRIATVEGHESIARFRAADPVEAAVLSTANALGRDYMICFLHVSHVPGTFKNAKVTRTAAREFRPYLTPLAVPDVNAFPAAKPERNAEARSYEAPVLEALPRLKAGEKAEAVAGRRLLVMRPVRALQASCMKCHVNAKQGDTLGVMVYAVDRK